MAGWSFAERSPFLDRLPNPGEALVGLDTERNEG